MNSCPLKITFFEKGLQNIILLVESQTLLCLSSASRLD